MEVLPPAAAPYGVNAETSKAVPPITVAAFEPPAIALSRRIWRWSTSPEARAVGREPVVGEAECATRKVGPPEAGDAIDTGLETHSYCPNPCPRGKPPAGARPPRAQSRRRVSERDVIVGADGKTIRLRRDACSSQPRHCHCRLNWHRRRRRPRWSSVARTSGDGERLGENGGIWPAPPRAAGSLLRPEHSQEAWPVDAPFGAGCAQPSDRPSANGSIIQGQGTAFINWTDAPLGDRSPPRRRFASCRWG